MRLPAAPHPRAQRQPRPFNSRSSLTLFSSTAPRFTGAPFVCYPYRLFYLQVFVNLTIKIVSVSFLRAYFRAARWPVLAFFPLATPALRAQRKRGHLMGRYRHGVPLAILLSLAMLLAGCGSTSSGPPPPPPPAPDFSLNLSANSVSVTQGAASPAVNVSVNPVNGFSVFPAPFK